MGCFISKTNIINKYHKYKQTQNDLKKRGFNKYNLIIGIDYSDKTLHKINTKNPYREIINCIIHTFNVFDNHIKCFGFGDITTNNNCLPFYPIYENYKSEDIIHKYDSISPYIKSMVTYNSNKFLAIITKALEHIYYYNCHHILIIITHDNIPITPEIDNLLKKLKENLLYIIIIGVGKNNFSSYKNLIKSYNNIKFINYNKEYIKKINLAELVFNNISL